MSGGVLERLKTEAEDLIDTLGEAEVRKQLKSGGFFDPELGGMDEATPLNEVFEAIIETILLYPEDEQFETDLATLLAKIESQRKAAKAKTQALITNLVAGTQGVVGTTPAIGNESGKTEVSEKEKELLTCLIQACGGDNLLAAQALENIKKIDRSNNKLSLPLTSLPTNISSLIMKVNSDFCRITELELSLIQNITGLDELLTDIIRIETIILPNLVVTDFVHSQTSFLVRMLQDTDVRFRLKNNSIVNLEQLKELNTKKDSLINLARSIPTLLGTMTLSQLEAMQKEFGLLLAELFPNQKPEDVDLNPFFVSGLPWKEITYRINFLQFREFLGPKTQLSSIKHWIENGERKQLSVLIPVLVKDGKIMVTIGDNTFDIEDQFKNFRVVFRPGSASENPQIMIDSTTRTYYELLPQSDPVVEASPPPAPGELQPEILKPLNEGEVVALSGIIVSTLISKGPSLSDAETPVQYRDIRERAVSGKAAASYSYHVNNLFETLSPSEKPGGRADPELEAARKEFMPLVELVGLAYIADQTFLKEIISKITWPEGLTVTMPEIQEALRYFRQALESRWGSDIVQSQNLSESREQKNNRILATILEYIRQGRTTKVDVFGLVSRINTEIQSNNSDTLRLLHLLSTFKQNAKIRQAYRLKELGNRLNIGHNPA